MPTQKKGVNLRSKYSISELMIRRGFRRDGSLEILIYWQVHRINTGCGNHLVSSIIYWSNLIVVSYLIVHMIIVINLGQEKKKVRP